MPLDQPHKPTFMHQFCNSFLQGLRVSIDAAGARGRGAHEGALEIAPTRITRIHRRGG
jgi:hypothetical protein